MPTIGYCHDCSEWVYVCPDWSCPSGHVAVRVNGWYDSETGESVAPSSRPAAAVAPRVAGVDSATPAAFLGDLLSTLSQNHAYCAGRGSDTDVIIASNPVDPSWGIGDERADYTAVLKVVEADRTVYFWELLRERGASVGTFESEIEAVAGEESSGATHERAIGPGSPSWEWGFGTLRGTVEEVAGRHGFTARVVLSRQSALW